jgi:hypothetical protein
VNKPLWDELDKSRAIDNAMDKKLSDVIAAFKSSFKG